MILPLPPGDFDGYIFDCDGTLADTMPIHYRAWLSAFKDYNAPFAFDEPTFYSLGGTPTRRIVEILNERHRTAFDPEALAHDKELHFEKLMDTTTPIETVVAYARQFKAEGKPVSVATGGVKWVIEKILAKVGLEGFFPILITPADVQRGKPFPDMFLLAAERMGTQPARTLVFEDAVPGFEAAQAAGMQYVAVPRPGV